MVASPRRVGLNRHAAVAAVLVGLALADPAAADPVIRGDATLLETVIDALKSNQQALSKGECDIRMEYSSESVPESSYSTTADVHVLWSGDQSYSRYTYIEDYPGDAPLRNAHGAQIINGDTRTVYVPEGQLCQTRPFQASGVPTYRDVLPADASFHWRHTRETPWTRFLEESPAVEAIELSREGDTILVKLLWMEDAYTQLEFSEPHSCNIVSWESTDEHGEVTMWGSQEWNEVDGVWYPTLSMHEWHTESDRGSAVEKFRIEIAGFDAAPIIAPDAFTIAALELPNGTEVTEEDANGRQIGESRMIGTRDPAEEQRAALEALVEEAQTNGFAREERTE